MVLPAIRNAVTGQKELTEFYFDQRVPAKGKK